MDEPKQKSKVNLGSFNSSIGLDRGAGKLLEASWYLIKMIFFLSSFPFPNSLKKGLLKLFGANIGVGLIIKPRVNIHMPWKLSIGSNVWIGEDVFMLNFEPITIGNNVCISQRAFLCGGNHNYLDPTMPYRNGPIFLDDGCWIGASCFIAPNVIVGVDTVVTAGSVVTRNLEGNSVYQGNPALYIKPRWK